MTSVLVFEFDKIFNKLLPEPPKDIKEICFPPLPQIHWTKEGRRYVMEAKAAGYPTVLLAYGKERYIKEAILGAGLCPYFDHFIILEELGTGYEDIGQRIRTSLFQRFGACLQASK